MSQYVRTIYVFVCAECGRPKQEANHWFMIKRLSRELGYYAVTTLPNVASANALGEYDLPCCGQEHLHILEQRIISGEIGEPQAEELLETVSR